ncbi:hypothetical protein D3C78_1802940 [compost metagenome]
MLDVIRKIYYGDTGSGDFAEVTVDSIANYAILLGNESISGDKRTVIYKSDIDSLVEALRELQGYL